MNKIHFGIIYAIYILLYDILHYLNTIIEYSFSNVMCFYIIFLC